MNKTKLVFIGGAPGTGKTTIAYLLANILKTDKVISTDLLKIICKTFIKEYDEPYLYTTTYEAVNVEDLSLIDAYLKHCNSISKYIYRTVNSMKNEKLIIIEGAQLIPNILEIFDSTNFECFFFNLYLTNKCNLINRYKKKSSAKERQVVRKFR